MATSVGQLLVERPARAGILTAFGIDYYCGGRRSLAQACGEHGVDPVRLVAALDASDSGASGADAHGDWPDATIAQLIDHIVSTHHAYVKRELPRIAGLLDELLPARDASQPRLCELQALFRHFAHEMESHMRKEELVLFPLCRSLEIQRQAADFRCGPLRSPIGVLIAEHDDAGDALERFRALTDDYSTPSQACALHVSILDALRRLEADMHRHVHEENNILFPMALAAEAELASRSVGGRELQVNAART
jgi:regulator of cell morphogenesis and NO signaling